MCFFDFFSGQYLNTLLSYESREKRDKLGTAGIEYLEYL